MAADPGMQHRNDRQKQSLLSQQAYVQATAVPVMSQQHLSMYAQPGAGVYGAPVMNGAYIDKIKNKVQKIRGDKMGYTRKVIQTLIFLAYATGIALTILNIWPLFTSRYPVVRRRDGIKVHTDADKWDMHKYITGDIITTQRTVPVLYDTLLDDPSTNSEHSAMYLGLREARDTKGSIAAPNKQYWLNYTEIGQKLSYNIDLKTIADNKLEVSRPPSNSELEWDTTWFTCFSLDGQNYFKQWAETGVVGPRKPSVLDSAETEYAAVTRKHGNAFNQRELCRLARSPFSVSTDEMFASDNKGYSISRGMNLTLISILLCLFYVLYVYNIIEVVFHHSQEREEQKTQQVSQQSGAPAASTHDCSFLCKNPSIQSCSQSFSLYLNTAWETIKNTYNKEGGTEFFIFCVVLPLLVMITYLSVVVGNTSSIVSKKVEDAGVNGGSTKLVARFATQQLRENFMASINFLLSAVILTICVYGTMRRRIRWTTNESAYFNKHYHLRMDEITSTYLTLLIPLSVIADVMNEVSVIDEAVFVLIVVAAVFLGVLDYVRVHFIQFGMASSVMDTKKLNDPSWFALMTSMQVLCMATYVSEFLLVYYYIGVQIRFGSLQFWCILLVASTLVEWVYYYWVGTKVQKKSRKIAPVDDTVVTAETGFVDNQENDNEDSDDFGADPTAEDVDPDLQKLQWKPYPNARDNEEPDYAETDYYTRYPVGALDWEKYKSLGQRPFKNASKAEKRFLNWAYSKAFVVIVLMLVFLGISGKYGNTNGAAFGYAPRDNGALVDYYDDLQDATKNYFDKRFTDTDRATVQIATIGWIDRVRVTEQQVSVNDNQVDQLCSYFKRDWRDLSQHMCGNQIMKSYALAVLPVS